MLRRVLFFSAALGVALGVSIGSGAPAHAEETGTGYVCAGVVITGTVGFGEPICVPVTDWGTVCLNQKVDLPYSTQVLVVLCAPKAYSEP